MNLQRSICCFAVIILGCTPWTSLAQSVPYHPFSTSNAIWRESSGGFQCSQGCCQDYQYTITGDTVINGLNYVKLGKTGVIYIQDNIGFCTQIISTYVNENLWGLLREDTLDKKVYYRNPEDTVDALLYDFDLELGDTLVPTFTADYPIDNVVTSVDSVFVGSEFRNRYGISGEMQTNYVYLIEGIGSTFGLLGRMKPPFESGSQLVCYMENDLTVFPDTSQACPLVSSISEPLKLHDDQVRISPQPATSLLYVTSNKRVDQTSIFNLQGQLVWKSASQVSSYSIDCSQWPNGIYVIRSASEGELQQQKLIVSH